VGEGKAPDKIGKVDFFKLLVWDLVLNKVIGDIPEAEYDALLDGLSPLPTEKRMAEVAERVNQYDVAILMEVPEAGLPGLDDFHVVRGHAAAKDATMNTVVFARKSLYDVPQAQDFYIEGLDPQPRIAECTLKSAKGELHVLGVHLSGKGYEGAQVAPAMNERIKPNTILAGDFNVDLRKGEGKWTDLSACPKLRALVAQAEKLPADQGSTNKERSCFQAQVSKMFMQDFSMKDFLFVGEGLETTPVEGLVQRSQLLPDITCPSDHCPLTTVVKGL
jgi:endonuclease/exonuclease/phosphatase family metal-dependent hydrolase